MEHTLISLTRDITRDTGFANTFLFLLNATTCSYELSWSPLLAVAEVKLNSEVGTPMRRSYVVPMVLGVLYREMRCQEGP
jgi:hypothetical protein